MQQKRVLFACLGNIVRSPLAEHLFLKKVQERSLSAEYSADSAGTAGYHVGDSPDSRMRQTASSHGLNYDGRARRVADEDFEHYDIIVAMDRSNRDDLYDRAAGEDEGKKIVLMRAFDPQAAGDQDVPDPYYGDLEGFEATYQIVDRSLEGFLDALERGEV